MSGVRASPVTSVSAVPAITTVIVVRSGAEGFADACFEGYQGIKFAEQKLRLGGWDFDNRGAGRNPDCRSVDRAGHVGRILHFSPQGGAGADLDGRGGIDRVKWGHAAQDIHSRVLRVRGNLEITGIDSHAAGGRLDIEGFFAFLGAAEASEHLAFFQLDGFGVQIDTDAGIRPDCNKAACAVEHQVDRVTWPRPEDSPPGKNIACGGIEPNAVVLLDLWRPGFIADYDELFSHLRDETGTDS